MATARTDTNLIMRLPCGAYGGKAPGGERRKEEEKREEDSMFP